MSISDGLAQCRSVAQASLCLCEDRVIITVVVGAAREDAEGVVDIEERGVSGKLPTSYKDVVVLNGLQNLEFNESWAFTIVLDGWV